MRPRRSRSAPRGSRSRSSPRRRAGRLRDARHGCRAALRREEIVRFGNIVEAVHIHIGATAIFGIAFLGLLAVLVAERRRARVELRLAGIALALLLAQMVVGEIQWREALPWGLVLLHVTLATAVWVVVVALAARIVLRHRARLP